MLRDGASPWPYGTRRTPPTRSRPASSIAARNRGDLEPLQLKAGRPGQHVKMLRTRSATSRRGSSRTAASASRRHWLGRYWSATFGVIELVERLLEFVDLPRNSPRRKATHERSFPRARGLFGSGDSSSSRAIFADGVVLAHPCDQPCGARHRSAKRRRRAKSLRARSIRRFPPT